jgi:hypothetical protein
LTRFTVYPALVVVATDDADLGVELDQWGGKRTRGHWEFERHRSRSLRAKLRRRCPDLEERGHVPRRKHRIVLALTAKQLDQIQERAGQEGLSVEDYVKRLIMTQ